ncbi:Chemotaxis protein CheA [Candidatus Arthromitus sp. SFB-mouse-SU]|nr:Chemotaxis protein CheA [Candidatus Arthromitus sp. SFB-1]EIA26690.1 Chemotaxis protein CheA [Candidatus Arthromitus sp. SFB-5]EIA29231.1 Chemotaxis protein CheA [Candidatus Arthromitus sp. SFB-co]EIA29576.1 Chemotaxis protein CheA [Candidatus Arthromitus sp. SFB-4]EIA30618.1 Chemotaxis protein CheA [Candidatus Arthromitus sp. SFB-mouse-SU]
MDVSQYLSMFLEESMENLSKLNDSLLELEQKPDNLEVVNEIFRVSHTIKGMSATMGYMKISELTHKMEDVLSKFRDGTLKVNRDVVTLLFKCLDTLESMINNISDGNNDEMDIEAIVVDLAGILEDKPIENINETIEEKLKLEDHHMNIINIDKTPYFVYEIKIVLADTVLLKTARVFIFFREIEKYGDIIHTLPSTQDIETENFDLEVDILYVTMMAKEKLQDIIKHISEIKKVAIKEINSDNVKKSYGNEVFINLEEASENLKNNIKSDDAKSEEISQVKNNRVVNEENINKVQINANNKDVTKEKASKSKQSMSIKKGTQSVRVDLDRLDMVMNMVSELVIHRTRLEQISNTYNSSELNETLEQIARSTSELQDLVMKIRMLPLEVVFNRFPRMIRDLSLELNKDIQFIIEGASTELDRTVIDEIGEPLIHLLRNAVDHGIETKEKRVEAGKNPTGQIQLYAYQEGTKAVIKIRDDGKGLDVDKIKAKAEKVGISSTNGMSDTDIKNLIFLEGFSTNDKVTDISGRGVGMDVVKTKISSLGGTIDLQSEVGKGSTFVIKLPLTLQIIKALLVKVNGETMAISLGFVDSVINWKEDLIKKSNNKEVLSYRDEIIPLIRMSKKFSLDSGICNLNNESSYIIVAKVGEKIAALLVDDLLGQQEIVIKNLGKSLQGLKEYIGATILGDGLVTLIVDVASIIS